MRQSEDHHRVLAWILCRTKYNPYEGDWWKMDPIHTGDGLWIASPCTIRQGEMRSPVIYTQTELARDIANDIHSTSGAGYVWKVVPYKATFLQDLLLTVFCKTYY